MTRIISRRLTAVALALLVGAGACEVTNPGPVQDEFLDEETSHAALVRGAERMVLETANFVFYTQAIITRVLFPGGDTNSHQPSVQGGSLPATEVNADWANVQQALFIAESALERGVTGENLAQAHLWAGYTYRILGENWCQWLKDSGSSQPPSAALDMAEEHFTAALGAAASSTQSNAAYAGRAQVRVAKGDWGGALGDAAQVPPAFVFAVHPDPDFEVTRSRVGWANADLPYRQFTLLFTFFGEQADPSKIPALLPLDASDLPVTIPGTGYYAESGDPRVAWSTIPDQPFANASLQGFGQVPWSNFTWLDVDTPVHLGTGAEMLLYRAEGMLRDGNYSGAMDLINQVRSMYISDHTGEPLAPWTGMSLEEAWTHLKTERMIEGLLEGRRLVDFRRWAADGSPGRAPYPQWEDLTSLFGEEPMATCFPISENEVRRNPNLSG
jgi:hypothetical protein